MILHHIPILQTAILALALTPLAAGSPGDDLLAIRVGKAETISDGTLEHAVILVENGKIVAIGEDLIIERGIPILDRPDWVVTPGLVNCVPRAGLDGRGGRSFDPQQRAAAEIYAGQDIYADLLAAGVTTLGLVPAGNGIPGQAVAVRTRGNTPAEMILVAGHSVILDAAFRSASDRDAAIRMAKDCGRPTVLLEVTAPPDVLRDRIRQRSIYREDASEAGLNVLEYQIANTEPLTADEKEIAIVCSNTGEADIPAMTARIKALADN